ncbi:UNVERIFIED_CONTAM: hypothetical protein GTU68_050517 [Idotea baltica]|nr:hypothetical protein [Idotea baltica]
MTVTDVRGCGSQGGRTEVYRGQEYSVLLIPKVKIEIAVNDEFLELAIEAIKTSAKSGSEGKIGDGKIFVQELNDCIRIRTGDKGSDAIGP